MTEVQGLVSVMWPNEASAPQQQRSLPETRAARVATAHAPSTEAELGLWSPWILSPFSCDALSCQIAQARLPRTFSPFS